MKMIKKHISKTICLFLAIIIITGIILSMPLTAVALTGGYFEYTIFGAEATITGYNGPGGNITIPSTIDTYPVKVIGSFVFFEMESLEGIIIPEGVEKIEDYAFTGCSALSSAALPSSLKHIGFCVFEGCENLTNILIPDKVNYIGTMAFYGCEKLADITIPNNVTHMGSDAFGETGWYKKQLDGVVYAGKTACGYKGYMPPNTQLTLNDGTISIADRAFWNYYKLTGISIPDGVVHIGNNAFDGCTGLAQITIPDSVKSMGYDAFIRTQWYENQAEGLIYAGRVVYTYKGEMPEDTVISLLPGTTGLAWGSLALQNGLSCVIIPEGVTSIAYGSLEECHNLTSIIIPDSVIEIENWAFYQCTGLKNITIPKNVKHIGDYVFDGCEDLIIYCYENSYTHKYAEENNISFEFILSPSIPGDVNFDDDVNIFDIMIIRDYIFGKTILESDVLTAADVNGDDDINIFDIMMIRDHIFGKIDLNNTQ